MKEDPEQVRAAGSHSPMCPKCGTRSMTRVERRGFLQQMIYPKFGYYPWECSYCRRISLIKSRGFRRRHHREQQPHPNPSQD